MEDRAKVDIHVGERDRVEPAISRATLLTLRDAVTWIGATGSRQRQGVLLFT